MNPTTDVLEKRIALLDGGVGALAVAKRAVCNHAGTSEYRPGRR